MPSSQGSTASVSRETLSLSGETVPERVPHILETVPVGADRRLFHQAVAETLRMSRYVRQNRALESEVQGKNRGLSIGAGRFSPITFASVDDLLETESQHDLRSVQLFLDEWDLYAIPDSSVQRQASRVLVRLDSPTLPRLSSSQAAGQLGSLSFDGPSPFSPTVISGCASLRDSRCFVVKAGILVSGQVNRLGREGDDVRVLGVVEVGWDYVVFQVKSTDHAVRWTSVLVPLQLCKPLLSWGQKLGSVKTFRRWRTLSRWGRTLEVGMAMELEIVSSLRVEEPEIFSPKGTWGASLVGSKGAEAYQV